MQVIVAGGRDFADAGLLAFVLRQERNDGLTGVISGMASGADRLGFLWAVANGIEVTRMPAEWKTYGRSAGYRRNVEMAKVGDRLVAFWDGRSPGTRHMINIARERGLPTRVIRYMKGDG